MYNFGPNVQVEAVDGEHRAWFVVEVASRPADWPESISLPQVGRKVGSLSDAKFRDSVIADADRLNRSLSKARQLELLNSDVRRTLPLLSQYYFLSDRFTDEKETSKARAKRNRLLIEQFLDWSESRGHPDVRGLKQQQLKDFLALYDDRPFYRLQMRSVMNILFVLACSSDLEWRSDNPMDGISWEEPTAPIRRLWTEEDVNVYAAASRKAGQPGLGALIETALYTGQRLGDLRKAQHGREYKDGHFVIEQSKTKVLAYPVVPEEVHQRIMAARIGDSEFLFSDHYTGKPFTCESLNARFKEVRHHLSKDGEELLQLDSLRHSCIQRMHAAGCDQNAIAHVTGHKYSSIHKIMEHYLQRNPKTAEKAIRQTHQANGGSDADFRDRPPVAAWEKMRGVKRYERPEWDPDIPTDDEQVKPVKLTVWAGRILGVNPASI